jgi:hypothetical protein
VQKTECESLDGSFLQFTQKATEPENIENTDCDYTKGHNLSCESKHSSDSDQSVNQRHVHWISKHSITTYMNMFLTVLCFLLQL